MGLAIFKSPQRW